MKFGDLNQWLTLVANFGVVAGLMLLLVEINQNTEMVRAQINQSRADTASPSNKRHTTQIIRKQDNNPWQYNQGFLGENIPRAVRQGRHGVIHLDQNQT